MALSKNVRLALVPILFYRAEKKKLERELQTT